MNCTVAGGTSPTAVTLCPSTTVEKAELEPTVALSATWDPAGALCWIFDEHRDRGDPVGEHQVIDRA